ncbi:MAG: WcbI family polysaccharide biosynthesis putative acetyltransferase, partial [Glaciihabitans sp.]
SLRLFLDGGAMPWIRMPAIHELVASDIPHLNRLLGRAAVLVSQPIQDDYHGLPIGTRNLVEALHPGSQTVIVPVIRFAGLYPTHVLIRPPANPGLTPPIVAYHDLRTLAEAADRFHGRTTPLRPVTPASVRAVGERSLQELRSRELRHSTVMVSDLFEQPTFDQMRTINHPGNSVWTALAARVRDVLGHERVTVDPGREILNNVHAPRTAAVIEAYGLPASSTSDWSVDGVPVSDDDVHSAHLRWYEQHPDVIDAGIARHRPTLEAMGFDR